jgi:hypothetical protein
VRILIDRGAELNGTDSHGQTPFHRACTSVNVSRRYGYGVSPEVIRWLILAGADTQARDTKGRLPVELLLVKSDDEESRAIYEEALVEMDSQALKPVLK